MSIQDFHSKLSSRNESNLLFEALRRLRRIDNIRGLLFEDETAAGGWFPWDSVQSPPYAVAET